MGTCQDEDVFFAVALYPFRSAAGDLVFRTKHCRSPLVTVYSPYRDAEGDLRLRGLANYSTLIDGGPDVAYKSRGSPVRAGEMFGEIVERDLMGRAATWCDPCVVPCWGCQGFHDPYDFHDNIPTVPNLIAIFSGPDGGCCGAFLADLTVSVKACPDPEWTMFPNLCFIDCADRIPGLPPASGNSIGGWRSDWPLFFANPYCPFPEGGANEHTINLSVVAFCYHAAPDTCTYWLYIQFELFALPGEGAVESDCCLTGGDPGPDNIHCSLYGECVELTDYLDLCGGFSQKSPPLTFPLPCIEDSKCEDPRCQVTVQFLPGP